jgi:Proteobacterial transcriptional regulator-like domain
VPDWRNPEDYEYTTRLTLHGWAWEFLRRSKEYRKRWRQLNPERGRASIPRATVESALFGVEFGLSLPVDPDLDFFAAQPQWAIGAAVRVVWSAQLPEKALQNWRGHPSAVVLEFDLSEALKPQLGATAGQFQVTTDGLNTYPGSIGYHLGTRTDYATLVKQYGSTGTEEQRRYSPPRIIGTERTVIHGEPDRARICTSHIERQNLTVRMQMRRFTRLTNGFSKKWENLRAALALHFAHYNLCRMHSSIRMTRAMKADVTRTPWTMAELLAA